jgi:hypothetical protein
MVDKKVIKKCYNIVKRIPIGYGYIVLYHGDTAIDIIPNYFLRDYENREGLLYMDIVNALNEADYYMIENKEDIYVKVFTKKNLDKKIKIHNLEEIVSILNDILTKYVLETV